VEKRRKGINERKAEATKISDQIYCMCVIVLFEGDCLHSNAGLTESGN